MKKCLSMLMAMGAILFASTLCATDTGVINSEDFESLAAGALNVNTKDTEEQILWTSEEADSEGNLTELAVVTAYGEEEATPENGGKQYLKLETGKPLYRRVKGGTTEEIGSGLYFEGDVQFSPYEEDVTEWDSYTKLLVYLKANETTTVNEDTQAETTTYSTNFVVVAGYYDSDNGVTTKYYECAIPTGFNCDKEAWHHLVLKANLTSNGYYAYFKVMVDGTYLTCTEAKGDAGSVMADIGVDAFPSIDPSYAPTTLEAIGFKGSGAIDNAVWTNEDPAPEMHAYKFVWTEGEGTPSVTAGEEVFIPENGKQYTYQKGVKVDWDFAPAAGYVKNDPSKDDSQSGLTVVTFTVTAANVSLQIGEGDVTYYTSFVALTNALGTATETATVQLLNDITESGDVSFDDNSSVILDLNGKTLTIISDGLYGAILTINNSADTYGFVKVDEEIYANSLTINGGAFSVEPSADVDIVCPEGKKLGTKEIEGTTWYVLVDEGGSTEPTIDGDSGAMVDPFSKTITVDSSTSAEITINGDASAYTITVPAKVTKITGTVKDVVIKAGDINIGGAFTVDSTTIVGVTTIALNPDGKVKVGDVEISVTPELKTDSTDVKPFDVASDGVSATVKAIPGLTYQLLASTTVQAPDKFDTTSSVAKETAGDTGSVTLTDTTATESSAKFYVIRVTR